MRIPMPPRHLQCRARCLQGQGGRVGYQEHARSPVHRHTANLVRAEVLSQGVDIDPCIRDEKADGGDVVLTRCRVERRTLTLGPHVGIDARVGQKERDQSVPAIHRRHMERRKAIFVLNMGVGSDDVSSHPLRSSPMPHPHRQTWTLTSTRGSARRIDAATVLDSLHGTPWKPAASCNAARPSCVGGGMGERRTAFKSEDQEGTLGDAPCSAH